MLRLLINEFIGNNKIFIKDISKNEISFHKFTEKVFALNKKIKYIDNKKVYVLPLENKISDFIFLISFLVSKKKILIVNQQDIKNLQYFCAYNLPLIFVDKANLKFKELNKNKKLNIDDFDILLSSSGSTGKSKLIKIKLKKSLINSIEMGKKIKFHSSKSHLLILPISHVNALFFSFFSSLIFKQKILIDSKFKIIKFWKILKNYKVNTTSVSPTLVKYLNIFGEKNKKKISTLKTIVCASSFLSKKDFYDFKKKFNFLVTQGYGLSEGTNFSTCMPSDQIELDSALNYFKNENYISIGEKIIGGDVQILVKKKINNIPGKIGEIAIKGKFMFNGYYPKKYNSNYFSTGDLGYFKYYNKKKFFFITARKKEIIKIADETIYPVDIENYLLNKLNSTVDLFCFSIKHDGFENIGCMVDKDFFNQSVRAKIINEVERNGYKYFPKFIFIANINKFKTKNKKPRRLFTADFINKLDILNYQKIFYYI